MPTREPTREWKILIQQMERPEFDELLDHCPALVWYRSWRCVVEFMHDKSADAPEKDAVLRNIVARHSDDHDPRWRTVLLAIFWPGLRSIARRRRGWDRDPDELWQNIVWIFMRAICRLDISRRSSRLAQKLINDVHHDLHDLYSRRWSRTAPEDLQPSGDFDSLPAVILDAETWILRKEAQVHAHRRLRRMFEGADHEATDALIVLATRLYDHALDETAKRFDLTYEAAKKRRQRAEDRLRRADHDE